LKGKILIATSSFGKLSRDPIDKLIKNGFEVVNNPYGRKLSVQELNELLKGAVGIIAGLEDLNRDVLKGSSLKVISRCGAGVSNVDLDAAKEMNIEVRNTPDAPTQSVAELTLGLILSLLRHVVVSDKDVREGKWAKRMGTLLHGKKLGIIGLGRIGKRVAELIAPFKLHILACDLKPDNKFAKSLNIKIVPFEELIKEADIISIHASCSECLIGRDDFSKMKEGVFIMNVSRGSVMDENALVQELKKGRIGGAALDVFSKEPYAGELTAFENVILTPHIGSYAKEGRIKMENQAVDNLIRAMKELK